MNTDSITDSISEEDAILIDIDWSDAGMQPDGLRIVGYRIAGNRSRTYLTVPGNDSAPCYVERTHNPDTGEYAPAYYHQSGPTLAEWQRQQDEREFMAQWQEARREAIELYEWASGR